MAAKTRSTSSSVLYGGAVRRKVSAAEATRRHLEFAVVEAARHNNWSAVAALLDEDRELVLSGGEWGTSLLQSAAEALPVDDDGLYAGLDQERSIGKFSLCKPYNLEPKAVATELKEALARRRPIDGLAFGLPQALFANSHNGSASRLLAARSSRWEAYAPGDADLDRGIRELFAVDVGARGSVWEHAVDNLIPCTSRQAYEDFGRRSAFQIWRVIAGPDLFARHTCTATEGVDVIHLSAEPASDLALCGRDLEGSDFAAPGAWLARIEKAGVAELACGICERRGRRTSHASFRLEAPPPEPNQAEVANIEVGVRLRVQRWLQEHGSPSPAAFREQIAGALSDALIYAAALRLGDYENGRAWRVLAGPGIVRDPLLREVDQLPDLPEETALDLLRAFAGEGAARSNDVLSRRLNASYGRASRALRAQLAV